MLKVLDLFSGIGGFSLGLERTGGFATVAFCEIEEFPRKVLAKHWPSVPCFGDVRTLSKSDIGQVDVICGGFPCQDLSIAGRQDGLSAERSGLWAEFLRLIGEIRPSYAIVENVANLLSGPKEQRGGWFGQILGDLAGIGYDAEWENIPASAVGLASRRERVWLVAYPQQVERVCTVFAGYHGAQRAWGGPAERCQNGLRPQVGKAVPSVFGRWVDKPDPTGVDQRLSDWPHRLGAVGNAVVPQIPELIGHAILADAEKHVTQ